MRSTSLMLAAAMAMGATAASAATVTDTVTYNSGTTPATGSISGVPLNFSAETISIPEWNPALFDPTAVLVGISLTFDFDWTGAYEYSVGTGWGGTGTINSTRGDGAYVDVSYTVTGPAGTFGQLDTNGSAAGGVLGTINIPPSPIPDQIGGLSGNDSAGSSINTANPVWGIVSPIFIGAGSENFSVGALGLTATSKSPGILDGISAAGNMTASVTYTYQFERDTPEIPVPAALPLLATAIGALGAARKFRKRA